MKRLYVKRLTWKTIFSRQMLCIVAQMHNSLQCLPRRFLLLKFKFKDFHLTIKSIFPILLKVHDSLCRMTSLVLGSETLVNPYWLQKCWIKHPSEKDSEISTKKILRWFREGSVLVYFQTSPLWNWKLVMLRSIYASIMTNEYLIVFIALQTSVNTKRRNSSASWAANNFSFCTTITASNWIHERMEWRKSKTNKL